MFKTHETVLTVAPASVGQVKDIIATLSQSVPNGMTSTDAQRILGGKKKFIADIKEVFARYTTAAPMDSLLIEWQDFYRGEFGIELDLSTLVIPERKVGLDRLLVIAEGMTIQRVYGQCSQRFKTWKYTDKDLDTAIPMNDRDPKNGTYAIWVRDTVEADEQFSNKSANDLKVANHIGITILERLIYELKYFKETGKHLDIDNVTLCSGSRNSVGFVPYVRWDRSDSAVRVHWCNDDYRGSNLRSREVVS
jgi:hypothetical protein